MCPAPTIAARCLRSSATSGVRHHTRGWDTWRRRARDDPRCAAGGGPGIPDSPPPAPDGSPADAEAAVRGGAVLLGRQLVSIVIGFGSLIALTRLIGPAKLRRVRDGLRRLPLRLRTGGLRRRDVPDQGYGGTDEASARRRVHPRDGQRVRRLLRRLPRDPPGRAVGQSRPPRRSGHRAPVVAPAAPLDRRPAVAAPARAGLQDGCRARAREPGHLPGCVDRTGGRGLRGVGAGRRIVASVVWIFVGFFRADRGWRPGVVWDRRLFREMLLFGAGFSVSQWAWQARTFVGPLLAGGFLGPRPLASSPWSSASSSH